MRALGPAAAQCGAWIAVAIGLWTAGGATAQAEAAEPLTIAVHTSRQPGAVSSTVAAIETAVRAEIARANAAGGVNGRPLAVRIYDDAERLETTVENVDAALKLPDLLAMVGVWSSTRGAAVVDRIGASGVPFISEISLEALYAPHPRIFSLARAAADDVVAFERFLRERPRRVVYAGVKGDLFADQFRDALERLARADAVELVAAHDAVAGAPLDPALAEAVAASLDDADLLVLGLGSARGGALLAKLSARGLRTPIYAATGAIKRMLRNADGAGYAGPLYQTSGAIPGVVNARLAERRPRGVSADDAAYGAVYADMIALIVAAARTSEAEDLEALRADVARNVKSYAAGRAVFRGAARDWSFSPRRSAVETVFLVERPAGADGLRLYPRQFTPDGQPVRVAHAAIDMVSVEAVDSGAKTFDATFYLTLESADGLTIDAVTFANVALSAATAAPLVSVKELDAKSGPAGVRRLYAVEGRFRFEPDLSRYPFDAQAFSIALQPKDAARPFFLQPPAARLRDRAFEIKGWRLRGGPEGAYVGADPDIVGALENRGATPTIETFTRTSFVWIAERISLDYALRVVLPLGLILAVAYLSIFIPNDRFDSAVALQVTALLSTVALYLAIPKLDAATATLSDQIFVYAEAAIVLVICLSILRVNSVNLEARTLARVIGAVQVVVPPALAWAAYRYVESVRAGGEAISGKSAAEAARIFLQAL